MDREKLKLLVRQLELVVDNIKAEVLSDTDAYLTMDTQISRAKRLVKMLERLVKQPYLYDEEQNKLIREQLKVAKNELAMIEEKTSKGFK